MSWYGLVYLGGEPLVELQEQGAAQGWNAVDVYTWLAWGVLPVTNHREIILERNVEGAISAQFAGTVAYEASANARLAAHFPGKHAVTTDLGALSDPWAVEVSGDPEADSLRPLEGDIEQARGRMIAYNDNDGDGEYGTGDENAAVMYAATGAQVGVAWTTPPDTTRNITMRLLITTNLVRFGWSVVNQSSGRPPASTDDLTLAPLGP